MRRKMLAPLVLLVLSAAGGRAPSPPPHSHPRLRGALFAGSALPGLSGLQLRLRGGGKKQKRHPKMKRIVYKSKVDLNRDYKSMFPY